MAALRSLDADGIGLNDVGLRRPTLDDVFLALTGHTSDDANQADSESEKQDA
jgi:ABC-2 type transport system ATP-binding protein